MLAEDAHGGHEGNMGGGDNAMTYDLVLVLEDNRNEDFSAGVA